MRPFLMISAVLYFLSAPAWADKARDKAQDKEQGQADPFGVDNPLPPSLNEILDPNGDGAIDDDEKKAALEALQKLPRTRQPVGQEIRKSLDANHDQKIDADEAERGIARGKAHLKGASNEVAEIVKHLDTNRDQKISVNEFGGLIQKLGGLGPFLAPQLGAFFNRMDTNRNGEITLSEAQVGAEWLMEQIERARRDQHLKQLLQDPLYQQAIQVVGKLDKNRDHQLSRIESRKNKEVNEAFETADTNHDEQLTLDECHAYLRQLASGKNPDATEKIKFLPDEKLKPAKPRSKRK